MTLLNKKICEDDDAGALVEKIRAGEPGAEEELVIRYTRGVMFLLRQRCGNAMLAEDLHQETFRIVIERLRRQELENPDRIAPYIRKVAVNLLIGEIRKSQRRNTYSDSDAIALAVDETPDIHQQMDTEQSRLLVHRLLLEMRVKRDREILRRFYVEEDEKQEICQDLQLSSSHFDRVLYRAKKRFRQLWEEHMAVQT